jgi:Cu/Zn superoxide dismutase
MTGMFSHIETPHKSASGCDPAFQWALTTIARNTPDSNIKPFISSKGGDRHEPHSLYSGCGATPEFCRQPIIGGEPRTEILVGLHNAQGDQIGSVTLLEDESAGVLIHGKLSKLPPGRHGFHIHAVGKCDPADFMSAGPHFNPLGKQHGLKNPAGTHAGDLPNLIVGPDGSAEVKVVAPDVTLGAGS